jgi:radical SAM protein with 4Fe4S-binding SPASM domain
MNLAKKKLILRPRYFFLQWHITERCNWHCKHCYQEEDYIRKEVPFNRLIEIFKQYLRLIKCLGTIGYQRTRLSITGGEPLLREDFFLFLERIYKYNRYFFLSILSNGSLINKENARRLKALGVRAVQVSLEGKEQRNDYIRGRGSFQKTINAIKILVEAGIMTSVSLTLTKQNISDISYLIDLCEKNGISGLGLRRLVAIGRGRSLKSNLLSPMDLKKIYSYIEQKQKELKRKNSRLSLIRGCEEGIFSQQVNYPLNLNSCAVIEGRGLVVLPNGDLIPCRRLPIKIGNIFEKDLVTLYYTSDKLAQLRNLNNAHRLCKECPYFNYCLSGAKCISYNYFNKLSTPDPQCWRLFNELPKQNLFEKEKERVSRKHRISYRFFSGTKSEIY